MPALSVITLTRNRFARLQACLDRLLPWFDPGDEVVLVDTGSTDGTRESFREFPRASVRFFELDRPGSWAEARNFAVAQARGDFIAFLDDDCFPDLDWVARGKAALADADAVGGVVRPHGIEVFPRWWHPNMGWMVGLSVPGHAGPDAGRIHYPATANLWARAAACRAVPFQEIGGDLQGEGTARYLAGREDAQWWRALRIGGWRTRFDPLLGVGHAIDPERLDLEYMKGRAIGDGRAWAAREGRPADFAPTAYGWWAHAVAQSAAPFIDTGGVFAEWHWRRLARLRQSAALRALAEQRGREGFAAAPAMQFKFWTAGFRLAADRARTLVRNLLQPWAEQSGDQPEDSPVECLVVIAFGFLGDLMILQSALRGLIKQYPQMTIHVAAPPAAEIALAGIQRITIAPPPENASAADWLADWLRDLRPDAIVAPYLHGPNGLELVALRTTPRPVFGFDADNGLVRRRHLERLPRRVHKNLEFHELQNLMQLFAAAGLKTAPQPSSLTPEPGALARARSHPFLASSAFGGPIVLFNPDAGQPQKEWTDAQWAELVRMTLDGVPCRIVFNASRPRPELERQVEALSPGGRVHWLQEAPLPDLIAWMSLCGAIVTVDAGPQHLAHALALPSLTLYGPMDERRWRDPWKRLIHRTLRACAFDLTPEERGGLPENHQTALIKPAAVFRELSEILQNVG